MSDVRDPGETERHRQAAYLFSLVQSAEEGEYSDITEPWVGTDVANAYDAGILFAARMILDNEAGTNDWPADVAEYAEEIRRRVVPGQIAFNDNATRAAAAEEALRDMADRIDRGPTFPVPPSVISALVRERAADLAP